VDVVENEFKVGNITEIYAVYGEKYNISLTGNFDDGFSVSREY
jgi:hypothetical protein